MKHHHKRTFLDKKWIIIAVIAILLILALIYKRPQPFQDNNPDILNPEGVRGPPNFHLVLENESPSADVPETGGP